MEQAVWLAFGVIAIIIGFAIIANLISSNKEELRVVSFEQSIEKLKTKCDFVCDSPLDTYLSVDVELSSGLRLFTSENRICGHLNISDVHNDENKCAVCKCNINGSLNLDTETAKKAFKVHKYSCYFERREDDIQMECKG